MKAIVERLENRRLFSGVPLSVAQVVTPVGLELRITGTDAADQINVKKSAGGFAITNTGGWSTTASGSFADIRVDGGAGDDFITIDANVTRKTILFGGAGNDTLVGGSGADRLYGGAGSDRLKGMRGNDILITLGGGKTDRAAGGAGFDSFWIDSDKTETISDVSTGETSGGNVHRVGSFINDVSKELTGQDLADPTADPGASFTNFSNVPLFSGGGPVADDVEQGYAGDCYFLATLSSVAQTNPSRIRQSVVDLGDGTYGVQFARGGKNVYVRVDGDLPTFNGSSPAYAGFGANDSLWTAVIEKAFASFRSTGTYDSIDAGWMSEAYSALGASSQTVSTAADGTALLKQIKSALVAEKSVTFAVNSAPEDSGLIGQHAYSVASVQGATITLRNPWAIDGNKCTDGHNDGYVTISASTAFAAMWVWTSAKV